MKDALRNNPKPIIPNLKTGGGVAANLASRQEAILAAVPEIIMEVDNNKVYTGASGGY